MSLQTPGQPNAGQEHPKSAWLRKLEAEQQAAAAEQAAHHDHPETVIAEPEAESVEASEPTETASQAPAPEQTPADVPAAVTDIATKQPLTSTDLAERQDKHSATQRNPLLPAQKLLNGLLTDLKIEDMAAFTDQVYEVADKAKGDTPEALAA